MYLGEDMEKLLQKIMWVKLCYLLAKRFRKEMYSILKREASTPGYHDQEQYESCWCRAVAMIDEAVIPVKKMFAVSVVTHREIKHGEDRKEEKTSMKRSMSDVVYKKANVAGWWQWE